jgi:hypothetical protein
MHPPNREGGAVFNRDQVSVTKTEQLLSQFTYAVLRGACRRRGRLRARAQDMNVLYEQKRSQNSPFSYVSSEIYGAKLKPRLYSTMLHAAIRSASSTHPEAHDRGEPAPARRPRRDAAPARGARGGHRLQSGRAAAGGRHLPPRHRARRRRAHRAATALAPRRSAARARRAAGRLPRELVLARRRARARALGAGRARAGDGRRAGLAVGTILARRERRPLGGRRPGGCRGARGSARPVGCERE